MKISFFFFKRWFLFLSLAVALLGVAWTAISIPTILQHYLLGSARLGKITQKIVSVFPEAPVQETPGGIVLSTSTFGIPYQDLVFLRKFRHQIIELSENSSNAVDPEGKIIASDIQKKLVSEFQILQPDLKNKYPELSDVDLWYAFLILRINGSFSTYFVRSFLPNDAYARLSSFVGNCSDHSHRMATILDFFYDRPTIFSIATPAIPGHVVVTVHHEESKTSYILDMTYNTFIAIRNLSSPFVETWISMTTEERRQKLRDVQIIHLPVYFRYTVPGLNSLQGTPMTENLLNEARFKQKTAYPKWLVDEFDEQIAWWKKVGTPHAPTSLSKFSPPVLRGGKKFSWNACDIHKCPETIRSAK